MKIKISLAKTESLFFPSCPSDTNLSDITKAYLNPNKAQITQQQRRPIPVQLQNYFKKKLYDCCLKIAKRNWMKLMTEFSKQLTNITVDEDKSVTTALDVWALTNVFGKVKREMPIMYRLVALAFEHFDEGNERRGYFPWAWFTRMAMFHGTSKQSQKGFFICLVMNQEEEFGSKKDLMI